jgi:hypothetical protein
MAFGFSARVPTARTMCRCIMGNFGRLWPTLAGQDIAWHPHLSCGKTGKLFMPNRGSERTANLRTAAFIAAAKSFLRRHPELADNSLGQAIALMRIRKLIDARFAEADAPFAEARWPSARRYAKEDSIVEKEIDQLLALPEHAQRQWLVGEDRAELSSFQSRPLKQHVFITNRIKENELWLQQHARELPNREAVREERETQRNSADVALMELIDAVLRLPVSQSSVRDLTTFKTQIQDGTIRPVDRNYAASLCRRLLKKKSAAKEGHAGSGIESKNGEKDGGIPLIAAAISFGRFRETMTTTNFDLSTEERRARNAGKSLEKNGEKDLKNIYEKLVSDGIIGR